MDIEAVTYHSTKIPKLGLGTWQQRGGECVEAVKKALSLGYGHIDTAQIYENEEQVGQGIHESGVPRHRIFLTTKVWIDNLDKMERSVEDSLRRLKTDYVDLLLLHWPTRDAPVERHIETLKELRRKGKTRLIGVSNYTAAQLDTLFGAHAAEIATNQVEYHPYLDQSPILDRLLKNGSFMTAYSPLARGRVMQDIVVKQVAKEVNKSEAQVALRWLIQQEGVVAIPKGSGSHIEKNFEIFDFSLSGEQMQRLHALARPDGRLIDPDFGPKWDTPPQARAA